MQNPYYKFLGLKVGKNKRNKIKYNYASLKQYKSG